MHEHGLAKELWPQLKQIARDLGFATVSEVDLTIGSLHGASAEFLAHSFEHAFEGSSFDGAKVTVLVVEPGDAYAAPNVDEPQTANGWEIFITKIEGEK